MASGDIIIRTTDGVNAWNAAQDSSNCVAQFAFTTTTPGASIPDSEWTGSMQITCPVPGSNNPVTFLQFFVSGADLPAGLLSGTLDIAIIEH